MRVTHRVKVCYPHFLQHRNGDVRSPRGGVAGAAQEHLVRRRRGLAACATQQVSQMPFTPNSVHHAAVLLYDRGTLSNIYMINLLQGLD